MRRAGAAFNVQLHQPLGRKADHAAQEIRVGGLLQKVLKGHSFVGHRRFLGCVEFAIRPYRRFGDDRPQAARSLRRYGERASRAACSSRATPQVGTRPLSLELRSLPSPGVTRLQRYYEPLRHPKAPACPSRASGWSSLTTPSGFPCCARFPSCTCCRHYPGAATGRRLRSSHPAVSAFPENVVGSACTSAFSRLARRSLALRPAHSRSHLYVTSYTEGFSHFVTSMTAPVASGWSVRRVGLAPTGKRRLSRRTRRACRSGGWS